MSKYLHKVICKIYELKNKTIAFLKGNNHFYYILYLDCQNLAHEFKDHA